MKRIVITICLVLVGGWMASAQEQQIKFKEYDLDNGLHVILHQDHTTPIVNVSLMYHVGSKNEKSDRTGFAHFFEHLMFEGSKNMGREEYMKLIQENGGVVNANTSQDRTYYFQILPSNQLELALWMESERMLHLNVDSIGIETQRKVVKEEKKQSYDNRPYGQLISVTFENLFTNSPYKWTPIGHDQYLDQASYGEFMDFYKLFYVPNNAVLVIAGDFDEEQTRKWIDKYFSGIPKGTATIPRPDMTESATGKQKRVTFHDESIKLPAVVMAYNIPAMGSDDIYALDMLSDILSTGASSRFQKQIVDKEEKAVQASSFVYPLEGPGAFLLFAIANQGVGQKELESAMQKEIKKLLSQGITDEEFNKVQNQTEFQFATQNARINGIAELLATNYTYFKNTNRVNTELSKYQKVTKEDIMRVAKKYLDPNNGLVLYYLP